MNGEVRGAAWVRAEHRVGALRGLALAMLATGVALILLLHVVPPTSGIDPISVTISEYGRTALAPVFVVAVTLVASGSAVALALFVRAREAHPMSVATVALALWILGMLGVALFPKADWATGATVSGYVHRTSATVAFIALAVAIIALIVGDRVRTPLTRMPPQRRMSAPARITAAACATAALIAVLALGVYIAVATELGVQWWIELPLGLLERLFLAVELTGLVTLVTTTRPLA